MSWVHPIMSGLGACAFGIISFTLWRSLAQELRLGKVDDLRWQAASLLGVSLSALTFLWEMVASPKPGTVAEYVRWGVQIFAILAMIYGIRGRRPVRGR